jgi:aryl-alcohol dehydrogenase-like predicted oxidoreductase
MNRRTFIRSLIAAAGSTALLGPSSQGLAAMSTSDKLGKLLPTRALGNTGERLTIMGLGGWHMAAGSESNSQAIIEASLEQGIRFFDCAAKYHSGRSEEVYGKFLTPKYRDSIYLMTKCDSRDPSIPAQQQLDDSLRRLNTDYIDQWLVHTVVDTRDARDRAKEMLDVLHDAKNKGKIRHFGFSGHKETPAMLAALDEMGGDKTDVALMPMNPHDFVSRDSFIVNVLPKLIEKEVGVLAMKTMNAGRFNRPLNGKSIVPDALSIEENQWFTLSLPITSWVSGMQTPEQVYSNTKIAKEFTSLSEDDRIEIADRIMDFADAPQLQPYRQWST